MILSIDGSRHPLITKTGIHGFYDDYRYLSNFHICPVEVEGYLYTSSEAAYMAQKTIDPDKKAALTQMAPSKAKRYGQEINMREDWGYYRVSAMTKVLMAKFTQNEELFELLMETENMYLEESNNWNDTFWGVDYLTGEGYNMLGKCLMDVRSMLMELNK